MIIIMIMYLERLTSAQALSAYAFFKRTCFKGSMHTTHMHARPHTHARTHTRTHTHIRGREGERERERGEREREREREKWD